MAHASAEIKIRLLRLLLLPLVLLATGCEHAPSLQPSKVAPEVEQIIAKYQQQQPRPAIWRISRGEQHGWLFGSVHSLPADIDWISTTMEQAFAKSDFLVLEVTGLEDSKALSDIFARMGNSPGQARLEQRVDPALLQKAKALKDKGRISDKQLETLESWALALRFAGVATGNIGISGQQGVERILAARYRDLDKPVQGLETITEQFGYFDRLPTSEQKAMLESVIADADQASQKYVELLDWWLGGNVPGIVKAVRSGLLEQEKIRKVILTDRNRDWAIKIEAMLARGEHPFIAVGAAHLAGEQSVQDLLVDQGFEVERVQ